MEMLSRKGTAVDAALAAAIALTVVEPTSNGIGGDAFALIWHSGRLHALNGSGRAPAAWTPDRFAGLSEMPMLGWDAVTVPGAVAAWHTLSERFGNLPFADLFEPAIRYARDGFPVSPITARAWARAEERFAGNAEFADVFLPQGRAPRAGERFASPRHAFTLEQIARSRGREFYTGAIADQILTRSRRDGGALTDADLANHRSEWVDPVSIRFRGVEVHETPPPGQGLAALLALGILDHHDLGALALDAADSVHLQV
jgi:gamma-glutamyltranspeptidase/glutathione hydrolase